MYNFSLLKDSKKVIVALSGGKDSSLCLLETKKFCKIYNIKFVGGLIINHNLREESYLEALEIKKYWKNFKINVKIISWLNPISSQKKAREFRLFSLSNFAYKNSIDTIVLGHNFQDKIETFLMRKEKNSNFWGLSSIAPITYIYDIKYIRPLISTNVNKILELIKKYEIKIFFDKTNSSNKYTRNIFRKNLKHIHIKEIIQQINIFIEKRKNLTLYIENWIKYHLDIIDNFTYQLIWYRLPSDLEISCYLLKYICEILSQKTIQNANLFLPYLHIRKNFHLQKCIFIHKGNYLIIKLNNFSSEINNINLWQNKILIINFKLNQKYIFYLKQIPFFFLNSILLDLSNLDKIFIKNLLIILLKKHFFSYFI